jgi:hypothetical protein
MARQRDLERAGWQFVRIRGGDFYRDRNRATEPLWQELSRLGIRPGGIDEAAAEPPRPLDRNRTEDEEVGETFNLDPSAPEDAGSIGVEVPQTDVEPASNPRRYQAELIPLAPIGTMALSNAVAEYAVYDGLSLPDPRTVNLSRVADGLCAIIEVEGPMIAKRAYDVYLRGCGIKRLGGELKSMMNKALGHAIHQKRVVSDNEPGQSGLIFSTVRRAGSPPVRLRTRGPRQFEEIPPGELRAMSDYLLEEHPLDFGSGDHLRAVLEGFGLKRLTTQVGTMLLQILEHARKCVASASELEDN